VVMPSHPRKPEPLSWSCQATRMYGGAKLMHVLQTRCQVCRAKRGSSLGPRYRCRGRRIPPAARLGSHSRCPVPSPAPLPCLMPAVDTWAKGEGEGPALPRRSTGHSSAWNAGFYTGWELIVTTPEELLKTHIVVCIISCPQPHAQPLRYRLRWCIQCRWAGRRRDNG
jgi:hypothetical protein